MEYEKFDYLFWIMFDTVISAGSDEKKPSAQSWGTFMAAFMTIWVTPSHKLQSSSQLDFPGGKRELR